MAQISKLAIFMRAFLMVFLAGTPMRGGAEDSGESAIWMGAVQEDTAEAYYTYLSRYPSGVYVEEAIAALIRLGALGKQVVAASPSPTPTPTPTATPVAGGGSSRVDLGPY